MTDKQITTLLLFAQNYPLQTIAKKQKVSLTTIRQRIKSLLKNHPKEFCNATALRNTYKRNRESIRNTKRLDLLDTSILPIKDKF
ncbi:hypothetical protein LCGC14_0404060 [marine sediment metagenome]|uniref:Uncharacterized protein n=1 Tax=marine sediment metagenome TaxID=412755 RepID=A0A0F9TDV3_9ZZZZ